tara:strand:+ start:120 stop:407 length:288 start_codon:yes stop_codon:yes gene_type:complete
MIRYRKKPVVVEAVQFIYEPQTLEQLKYFCGSALGVVTKANIDAEAWAVIKTLEDGANGQVTHVATEGDYIIKGVQGEFYPCKPDIFAATYEAVT